VKVILATLCTAHVWFYDFFKEIIYMIMIFVRSVGGSSIRNVTISVADEKDLEFVQGLQNLGVNRNVARVITFLKDQKERSAREIETATDLRQPEVSIAMRTLRERNWLTEHEIKAAGKGRPMKLYKLSVPLNMIINHYEEESKQESAQAMMSIQRLKELTTA